MAKKDNETQIDDVQTMDVMPGADPLPQEEAGTDYKVDMNFETEEEETQEEETSEEVEETESDEETSEEPEEEPEEEVAEDESEDPENTGEESVLEADDGDTQQPEGTDEAIVDETKEPMIPKSRFDQVLEKQKALQKKLDEALAPKVEDVKEAPEYDFDAKEAEYASLLMEGENNKAIQLRNEIRTAEKQQMMFEVQAKMGQTVNQNQEMVDLQTKANQLEAMFPELNQASPDFSQDKTNEVLELRDAYMTQGYTGAIALEKSVTLLMGTGAPTEPQADPVQKEIVQKKQMANTKKKIEASEKQPPAMKGKNKADKKIDIKKMTLDDFDALPAETLRRMRGDFG